MSNSRAPLNGILHELPDDMQQLLVTNQSLTETWNKLTPIQRNEWICWVSSVKKETTRQQHLARLVADLTKGKRQPCCWPGCPHRNPNAQKWFKGKAKELEE